jgi:hypothetical protein
VSTDQHSRAKPETGEPLKKPAESVSKRRGRLRKFAVPFFAVLGYYIVGVATFAIMASSNAPSGADLLFFLGFAAERTGPFALIAAVAAGYWWQ